ncbi:hypothetical protein [Haloglycomyces albus]|uniref:hypothetical protein n=1 Tax=Haloglycomyces albus TaxID=526067 RepID=UPI00046D33F6|nr:hypothetical protein [Haloglycomyces albus]
MHFDPAGNRLQGPIRRWLSIGVIVVALVLVGSATLLDRTIPDLAKPTGNDVLLDNGDTVARIELTEGWRIDRHSSSPPESVALEHGQVRFHARLASFPTEATQYQIWTGFVKTLRVTLPSGTLTPPKEIVSSSGVKGLAASYQRDGEHGEVYAFPNQKSNAAVEMILLGPQDTGDRNWTAAVEVAESMTFGETA